MEGFAKIISPELLPVVKEVMMSLDPMKMLTYKMEGDLPVINLTASSLQNVEFINKEWQFREGDILIASYPKTGTNWTVEVVDRMLHQDPTEFELIKSVPLPLRVIEMAHPKKFQILDSLSVKRRIFVTHLTPDLLDIQRLNDKKVKIVYVLRNPKDTLVSMYNFMKKLPPFQHEPLKGIFESWTTFYTRYMQGAFPVDENGGKYLEHIVKWLNLREKYAIHFLYFEDMKKNFGGEVQRIAKHLDLTVSAEKLAEIENKCSIDAMRKSYQDRAGFQGKFAGAFINKGGVGGWKNIFSVAQSEEWDAMVEAKLSHTDINFQYTI